jgi:hypothetical protein
MIRCGTFLDYVLFSALKLRVVCRVTTTVPTYIDDPDVIHHILVVHRPSCWGHQYVTYHIGVSNICLFFSCDCINKPSVSHKSIPRILSPSLADIGNNECVIPSFSSNHNFRNETVKTEISEAYDVQHMSLNISMHSLNIFRALRWTVSSHYFLLVCLFAGL